MAVSDGAVLGAAGISFLGNLIGGGLNSAISTYQQKELMKYQAKLNYKYAKKSALNQYGWQRQGLESAGYNPLLALNGAEGVANTGWSSASGGTNPGIDATGAINSALAFMQQKRENDLAESQIDLNKSQKHLFNEQAENFTEQAYAQSALNQFAMLNAQEDYTQRFLRNQISNEELKQMIIKSDYLEPQIKADLLKTFSEVKRNSASAYYDTHRALGFSESYSEEDGSGVSGNLGGSVGSKIKKTNVSGNLGGSYNKHKSKSHSRTW